MYENGISVSRAAVMAGRVLATISTSTRLGVCSRLVVVLLSAAVGLAACSAGNDPNLPGSTAEATQPAAQHGDRVSRFGEYAGYTESRFTQWVRSSQYVEMRDGVRLAVDIIRPAVNGVAVADALPVIYTMQRYGRSHLRPDREGVVTPVDTKSHIRELVKRGYVYVSVGIRGSGASFGSFDGVYGANEARDAFDIAEWIVGQPWSNGRLGIMGNSYRANAALMAASMPHPGLKAIFPSMMDFDNFLTARPGGVLLTGALDSWTTITAIVDGRIPPREDVPMPAIAPVDGDTEGQLMQAAQRDHSGNVDVLKASAQRLYRDDYNYDPELEEAENLLVTQVDAINRGGVAIYLWSGWRDIWPTPPFLWMANLQVPRKLAMGPWTHDPDERDAEQQLLAGEVERVRLQAIEMTRWFDYWLKEIDNGIMDEPPITYTVGDSQGNWTWRNAQQWPLTDTDIDTTPLFLADNGALANRAEKNAGNEAAADQFEVDLSATTGPQSRWIDATSFYPTAYPDLTGNGAKGLVYVTEPAPAPFEIIGHPLVTLNITASAADADIYVYLERISADGAAQYLTEGNLRASHRTLGRAPYNNLGLPWPTHARRDVEAAAPIDSTVAQLHFALMPIAERVGAGERLRLSITAADSDNFETGPAAAGTTITVLRAGNHLSSIALPIGPAQ